MTMAMMRVADSTGGAAAPLIDRMHLKIYENFASKCVIFASNFHKFSGKGTAPYPDPIPYPSPLFPVSGSATG